MTRRRQAFNFSLPKIGESSQNAQDRFASNSDVTLVALSDGAGSSLYPRKWAEILVESFCSTPGNPIEAIQESYVDWLKPLQERWRQYYLEQLKMPNRKWWAGGSQFKNRGSATFLGLWLSPDPGDGAADGTSDGAADADAVSDAIEERRWQAIAVGDSCLFKWEREADRLLAFPLARSSEFKRTAKCFESLPEHASFPPQLEEGFYQDGDCFYLVTDALAKWILQEREREGGEWKKLFELEISEEFATLVERLREKKEIENDDTTMVAIRNL